MSDKYAGVNIEKLIEKLNSEKIEELSKLIDKAPTINYVLDVITKMKENGTLDALINFSYMTKELKDMLNDEAIEKLSLMMGNMLNIATYVSFNSDKIVKLLKRIDLLNYTLEELEKLKNSGTLAILFDMLYIVKELRDMLGDEAIEKLSSLISNLLELLQKVNSPVIYNLISTLTSPEMQKLLSNPPEVGITELLRDLRDKNVKRGLGIILTMVRILGEKIR